MSSEIFSGYGVEVTLPTEDNFLKVKETLTRIGVASRKDKTLFQSVHILHKRGLYSIIHFKELFALDGKPSDFSDEDKGRRNTIVKLLADWGLVKIVDGQVLEPMASLNRIKILSFSEKNDWSLVAKYSIGRKIS
jgi:hypothetical protein